MREGDAEATLNGRRTCFDVVIVSAQLKVLVRYGLENCGETFETAGSLSIDVTPSVADAKLGVTEVKRWGAAIKLCAIALKGCVTARRWRAADP